MFVLYESYRPTPENREVLYKINELVKSPPSKTKQPKSKPKKKRS